jgi:signal transduction histidine kinase
VLGDDPPDLALARQAMQHAATQSRRARDVLTRLRRLVERPDAARLAEAVALVDAAHEVLDLMAPDLAARQVRLVHARLDGTPASGAPAADPAHTPALVLADPVALQQIIHNLLTNALQALDQVPAGERTLELQVGARRAASVGGGESAWRGVLVVADSGPGLSDEALARVFEPFYSTRSGGLGLGLSLCETLALGMGGTLTAGRNTSRGARFELSLPLADGSPATPARPAPLVRPE